MRHAVVDQRRRHGRARARHARQGRQAAWLRSLAQGQSDRLGVLQRGDARLGRRAGIHMRGVPDERQSAPPRRRARDQHLRGCEIAELDQVGASLREAVDGGGHRGGVGDSRSRAIPPEQTGRRQHLVGGRQPRGVLQVGAGAEDAGRQKPALTRLGAPARDVRRAGAEVAHAGDPGRHELWKRTSAQVGQVRVCVPEAGGQEQASAVELATTYLVAGITGHRRDAVTSDPNLLVRDRATRIHIDDCDMPDVWFRRSRRPGVGGVWPCAGEHAQRS